MGELRVQGFTHKDLVELDRRAAEHGMKRSAFVRWLLLAPSTAPMTEAELHQLVAQKARAGNMRAIEILARRTAVPAIEGARPEPEVVDDSSFAEVIALAGHRG